MNDIYPEPVQQYLLNLPPFERERSFAYLQVSMNSLVVSSGGELTLCSLDSITRHVPVDVQLSVLSGLLPLDQSNLVIHNAQVNEKAVVDLHVFQESGEHWVLFFDSTESARELQAEQQERLSEDFEKEEAKKRA